MANSSATGGYLAPIAISPPLEDAELEALFLGFIAGVSGLPPEHGSYALARGRCGTARAKRYLVPDGHPGANRGRRPGRRSRPGRGRI